MAMVMVMVIFKATFVTPKQRGYSVLEFVVTLAVVATLMAVLLNRMSYYQVEAEKVSFMITIANLRSALQLQQAASKLPQSTLDLTMLAEENPFNWLKDKPGNYVGEYFSPTDAQIGKGNWCYDRRDKSVVYLSNNPETFFDNNGKRLKFKVKSLRLLNISGAAENSADAVVGIALEQVED